MIVTFPIDLLYEYFLAISKRLQLSFFTYRFKPYSVAEVEVALPYSFLGYNDFFN